MRLLLDLQAIQGVSGARGIGRYSFELAKGLVRNGGDHEIWLCLGNRLPVPWDRVGEICGAQIPPERVKVLALPGGCAEINPENRARAKAAERIRETAIAALRPDVVHVASLFEGYWEDKVTSIGSLGRAPPSAVTLYDLIPLLRSEDYLADDNSREWYRRKIVSLGRAGRLLAISRSSRQEAVEHLGVAPARIPVIHAGITVRFNYAGAGTARLEAMRARYGLDRPFVLYNGSVEPRKNMEGMIEGFGALPEAIRSRHILAIACSIPPADRKRLSALADRCGIERSQLVFTDYVPDEDLRLLYSTCSVFVFPSLHEGFGLPVLEAMACGAPTIVSDASSMPEIVGRADATFDGRRPGAIAERIAAVLTDPGFARSLRDSAAVQVGKFTWDNSAKVAWQAFEEIHAERQAHADAPRPAAPGARRKPRLALVTSPSASTGLARGAALASLNEEYEVAMVSGPVAGRGDGSRRKHGLAWFEQNADRFDVILYDLADDPGATFMLDLLERWPGIVLLNEPALPVMFRELVRGLAPEPWFARLYGSAGVYGVRRFSDFGTRPEAATALPLILPVFEHATGILVGSEQALARVRDQFGMIAAEKTRVLPDAGIGQAIAELTEAGACLEARLVAELALPEAGLSGADLAPVAQAVALNRAVAAPPSLFLDVSVLAANDAGTGIQRVIRNFIDHLTAIPPAGFRPALVTVNEEMICARTFEARHFGLPSAGLPDEPADLSAGSVFLGLDLNVDVSPRLLERLRQRNIGIYFMVYDLLPVTRPALFPGMDVRFPQWLKMVAEQADGVVCISHAVADEFCDWLARNRVRRPLPIRVGVVRLGSNLDGKDEAPFAPDEAARVAAATAGPAAIMVGTLEPRKAHAQALAAFETLWRSGSELRLIIAGRAGWAVEELVERLRHHPELDRRLFWVEGASDAALSALYRSASVLLAPSFGEGFGLPLVEAARRGLPILARDLPVFREVAGDHATYFNADAPEGLAAAIAGWFADEKLGRAPGSAGIPSTGWSESTRQLLSAVIAGRWYRVIEPGPRDIF